MFHFINSLGDKIIVGVLGGILSLGASLGIVKPPQNLGASIPKVVAVFETSLASKITSSDTTMTLVSGSNKAGNSLSGYIGFVIDEGTASEEFVACTASGTALTSCIRGIDPVDGDLEVSALKLAHRRGASVKITNYPVLGVITRILNGDETLPNLIKYASSTSPCSANDDICDKSYIDGVAVAGASDAGLTTKGIVEIATKAETTAGTATGDTTAPLSVPNSYFNATSSATTTVPVTNASGKLSSGFIDQTVPYTWSSTSTFSGPIVASGLSAGVLLGNGSSAVTSVTPGTSGNILRSDGSIWVSTSTPGLPVVSLDFASSTVVVPTATTSTVKTITLTSASTTSYYKVRVRARNDGGVSSALWSVTLGGTEIAVCGTTASDPYFDFDIQMLNSTSSEAIHFMAYTGSTNYCGTQQTQAINMSSSPQLLIRVRHALGSDANFHTDFVHVYKYN